MDDSPPAESGDAPSVVDVRCYFVRKRNALLVRGQFGPLFIDYYLNQVHTGLRPGLELDAMMKEALVGVTLHAASRPWAERHAWTVNFQDPLANFFATADNTTATVTGRVFTDDVKVAPNSLFYAQVQKNQETPRTSTIEIQGKNFLHAVEQFYTRSEQRPGRFFEPADEDYVFVSAQPQCDVAWLYALTRDDLEEIDQKEELSLLETRSYRWECGCNLPRIYQVLAPIARRGIDELFAGDEFLKVTCPRCGNLYRVQREQFEAWLAADGAA